MSLNHEQQPLPVPLSAFEGVVVEKVEELKRLGFLVIVKPIHALISFYKNTLYKNTEVQI